MGPAPDGRPPLNAYLQVDVYGGGVLLISFKQYCGFIMVNKCYGIYVMYSCKSWYFKTTIYSIHKKKTGRIKF